MDAWNNYQFMPGLQTGLAGGMHPLTPRLGAPVGPVGPFPQPRSPFDSYQFQPQLPPMTSGSSKDAAKMHGFGSSVVPGQQPVPDPKPGPSPGPSPGMDPNGPGAHGPNDPGPYYGFFSHLTNAYDNWMLENGRDFWDTN